MGASMGQYQRLKQVHEMPVVGREVPREHSLERELAMEIDSHPTPEGGRLGVVRRKQMSKILRYSVLLATVVAIVCLFAFSFDIMVDMAPGFSNPESLTDPDSIGQLYDRRERSFVGPLATNAYCAQDGAICICSSHTSCHPWYFQVGDVLIFEPAYGYSRIAQWAAAALTAMLSGTDAMHVAAVTEVYSQTPDGIFLVEALKPPNGFVQKTSLRIMIHRWPLIGFWIRRADPARFTLNTAAMKMWSDSVKGQPYDKLMVVPFFRRWITHGRYIKENPDYKEKQRAIQLYNSGGPGMWVCTQLIAWLLAFPGGININNEEAWPIKKMQDFPGDFLRLPIWDGQNTHIKCYNQGCYLALPR